MSHVAPVAAAPPPLPITAPAPHALDYGGVVFITYPCLACLLLLFLSLVLLLRVSVSCPFVLFCFAPVPAAPPPLPNAPSRLFTPVAPLAIAAELTAFCGTPAGPLHYVFTPFPSPPPPSPLAVGTRGDFPPPADL